MESASALLAPPFAPLLVADALVKRYPAGTGALEVLHGVSMHVAPGEFVSIVGESGTGKSTLLHLLGALDRPTSGTVRFRGEDVFKKSDEALAAFRGRHVGFVFQFHHLLPEFTALENAAMPALVLGQSLRQATPRAQSLLERMGLGPRLDHRPGQLSGGEQQRVAVARALMNAPDVVLMDEPTGNLDESTAESLHDEIVRLRDEEGRAFVIVTHNLRLAARADRMLRMEGGALHDVTPARSHGGAAHREPAPGPV